AAMEAQCAGTPTVTSPVAALPETLRDAGAAWVPLDGAGQVDAAAFAQAVLALRDDPTRWCALHEAATAAAPRYAWCHAADAIERVVEDTLRRQCGNPRRVARHLLHTSDVMAAQQVAEQAGLAEVRGELREHYGFALGDAAAAARHTEAIA